MPSRSTKKLSAACATAGDVEVVAVGPANRLAHARDVALVERVAHGAGTPTSS